MLFAERQGKEKGKGKRKGKLKRKDGFHFKIVNIFSNFLFSLILHFLRGYKIWNTQLS